MMRWCAGETANRNVREITRLWKNYFDTRDWRDRQDEGEFEVRSSRFSELRTPNLESRVSRMSDASHATIYGAGRLYQQPVSPDYS
jgi:hypothetical protein